MRKRQEHEHHINDLTQKIERNSLIKCLKKDLQKFISNLLIAQIRSFSGKKADSENADQGNISFLLSEAAS